MSSQLAFREFSLSQIIREKQNQSGVNWSKCIGEWIDNSVGNGARNVWVTFTTSNSNSGVVEIRDDGFGCNSEMFSALVSPYGHEENDRHENTVSRFGVGAKVGMLWCKGETRCYSRRPEESYHIEIDWSAIEKDMSEGGEFIDGNEARQLAESVGIKSHGVAIRQTYSRKMDANNFQSLHKTLSKQHWAAIESGVNIEVVYRTKQKGRAAIGGVLPGKPMPEFIDEHRVKDAVILAGGRTIGLDGGILKPGVRLTEPGFEYIYGHRVLIPAGGTGSGGMDYERVYVRVFLEGDKEDWEVTTNKDGLDARDESAVEQAVFDRCKALLEAASSEAVVSAYDQELLGKLSEMGTAAHRRKAKRSPKNASSTRC